MPIRQDGALPKIRSLTCGHWSDSLSRFRYDRRCASARRCSRPPPLNWKGRSNPSPNISGSVFSQVKEDLFPPISQPKRSFSLVVPRAVYWFNFTAAVGAILVLALHLGGASCGFSLAWKTSPAPDITKYIVYWGSRGGVSSESAEVRSVTTATIAELNEPALIALAWLSQSGVRDDYFGSKYGLSITH
jgi:hypothetical protein